MKGMVNELSTAPDQRHELLALYDDAVAEYLDRTEGATDVLLVRARNAFRGAYEHLTAQPEGGNR